MLIGLIGKKGSGKDTFAAPLLNYNWVNLKMAGALKEMLYTLLSMAGVDNSTAERMIEGDLKEVPTGVLQGKTPRHAMQTLGTEWRDTIGRDLWISVWKRSVQNARNFGEHVVCTDVRFEHEARAIRDMGGFLIRIKRDLPDSGDTHPSELEMESITEDFTVYNKTIEETQAVAISLLKAQGDTDYAVLSRVLGRDHTDYFPR